MEIAKGIHRVDGTRVSNAYVVETSEGLLLVDTGMSRDAQGILRFVETLGNRPSDIRHIVLTHCDMDHVGGAARLRQVTGAMLAMGDGDAGVVAGERGPDKGGRLMRVLTRVVRVRHVAPDVRLNDGDSIAGFHVLHVPGHTRGSIVLWRGDGVAFTGDALLGDKAGRLRPPDPRLALDKAEAMASAEKIKALPVSLFLPGHGQPVRI